jgi:hypothetical protein
MRRSKNFPWVSLAFACATALAADKRPTGPELAQREIGHLLKAYPRLMQKNLQAVERVGVYLWGWHYQVGAVRITITISTQPRDPMPCKRKVALD